MSAQRETGKVKWFDAKKGYGFIINGQGEDIFVHHSEIDVQGFRTLNENQQVNYILVEGKPGKGGKATNVRLADG